MIPLLVTTGDLLHFASRRLPQAMAALFAQTGSGMHQTTAASAAGFEFASGDPPPG